MENGNFSSFPGVTPGDMTILCFQAIGCKKPYGRSCLWLQPDMEDYLNFGATLVASKRMELMTRS